MSAKFIVAAMLQTYRDVWHNPKEICTVNTIIHLMYPHSLKWRIQLSVKLLVIYQNTLSLFYKAMTYQNKGLLLTTVHNWNSMTCLLYTSRCV